ncbi:DUF1738 domain-containing protein [Pseudoalteromonas sp. SG41-1]|uniref:zincin-like metallopeptidase domain-containing protein n=1 Tax=Pseudoalteromonas sp. SG41-1 TaxID=2760979 RepID=UPI001600BCCA|nr:zincin-like metallopeptidase domain-containing protein [Pseudoalteromonas sp. SG41-1]MBB1507983.1 DUF1738 domain-containing protein [Pseudoalteromonas sp. SG41-1]
MTKEKLDVLALIKEEFISENKHIKSIKQLNFYMKRNKFEADKATIEKYEAFLDTHPLKKMVDNPFYNDSELTLVKECKQRIKDNNADGVDDFIEYVKEKAKEYDITGTPTVDILNVGIAYGMPKNAVNNYSGVNVETLMIGQQKQNLSTPIFITKTQLIKFGANPETLSSQLPKHHHEVWFRDTAYVDTTIEKGKKGRYITKEEYDRRELTGEVKEEKVNKSHKVYHFDQLPDELKTSKLEEWYFSQPEYTQFKKQQQAIKDGTIEQLFDEKAHEAVKELFLVANELGVKIVNHESNECYYDKKADTIYMAEQSRFVSNVAYAGVLAHELGHSTGHPSRLNREMVGHISPEKSKYGFEEIVAQSFSEMILSKHGLKATLDHHSAAYIYEYLSDVSMSKKQQLVKLNQAVWTAQKAVNLYNEKMVKSQKHNLSNERVISDDNTYITEPNDKLEDIARLVFKGRDVGQEMIDKAVVLIVKKNKLPDPTKTTASRRLDMPTIEEVYDYEFEKARLDSKNDLMRKENYIEPNISSGELVQSIIHMFKDELKGADIKAFEKDAIQLVEAQKGDNVMFNITDHDFVSKLDNLIKQHVQERVEFDEYLQPPMTKRSSRLSI